MLQTIFRTKLWMEPNLSRTMPAATLKQPWEASDKNTSEVLKTRGREGDRPKVSRTVQGLPDFGIGVAVRASKRPGSL